MLTGVTVTDAGRVFFSVPRWGDSVPYTVAEIVDGKPVAYPSQDFNDSTLVSVQSVVMDPAGHLWLLDTGSIAFAPWGGSGPQARPNRPSHRPVVRVIGPSAVTPTSYLNDVRFDLTRGPAGYAYITDLASIHR